ncbi:hypothetical protein LCGC14_1446910 [marine sediment metagenome]|uniref:Apea-like HEPN domain-containing protein n=1 Tax=marine sediment metagenome TaxID=412755 RepID=A0A0F9JJR0_9ZZZZ|nr:tetratricopeptide repeat protein [bacterium]
MDLYHNSLYTFETNPSISLCFLISSIETLAEKYIEVSEDWVDYSHLGFYNSLKKILKKVKDEKVRDEIFKEIGEKFLKAQFQVKSRFRKFLLDYANNEFRLLEDSLDKFFKEFTGEYYDLRSKYMHSGTDITIPHHKKPILFNRTKKGKLKTYDKGSKSDVRILPSFETFSRLIKGVIINFLDYLYINKNDDSDKQRYGPLDSRKRGVVEITPRDILTPGTALFGTQIHMKEQYLHQYENSKKLQNFKKNNEIDKVLAEYNRMKLKLEESQDYRRVVVLNIELAVYYIELGELKTAFSNLERANNVSEEQSIIDYHHIISYNFACCYYLLNDLEKASEFLSRVIGIQKFRGLAKNDKHLANLRENSDFNQLFEEKN